MSARLTRAIAAASLATAVALVVPAGRQVEAQSARPPRLVAIGDVHGDLESFLGILRRAGLIDAMNRWSGQQTTLVQTGDFVDRGPKVREVMDLLMALESQASAVGGQVITLLGNHEGMNLVGELRDVSPATYASFATSSSEERRAEAYDELVRLAKRQGGSAGTGPYRVPEREGWMATHPPGFVEFREALSPKGTYGQWVRKRPAAVQIDDTVFVHGGLQPALAPKKLDDLNDQLRRQIEDFDRAVGIMVRRGAALPFFTIQEFFDASRLQLERANATGEGPMPAPSSALAPEDLLPVQQGLLRIGATHLLNPNGPLWFRGYATWRTAEADEHLPVLFKRYGASRVVVGHTIMSSMRVTSRFSGRVVLIDTGMLSSYYKGGRASAIEIRGDTVSAIYEEGVTTPSGG